MTPATGRDGSRDASSVELRGVACRDSSRDAASVELGGAAGRDGSRDAASVELGGAAGRDGSRDASSVELGGATGRDGSRDPSSVELRGRDGSRDASSVNFGPVRAPFDAVAERYDAEFSRTLLGGWLRERVWAELETAFPTHAGARVLELGCGTGEDAIRLAQRGISVFATDVSAGMLRAAAAKAAALDAAALDAAALDATALAGDPARADPARADPTRADPTRADPTRADPTRADPTRADPTRADPAHADLAHADPTRADPARADPAHADPAHADATRPGRPKAAAAARLGDRLRFAHLDASAPNLTSEEPFDGALANFGVLNCVPNRQQLAQWLEGQLRPGGVLVAVLMGPFCAWETAWYVLRGDLNRARRRARSGGLAQVGDQQLPVWYPSPHRLAREFAPHFHLKRQLGVGALLPPSYLARLVDRWPRLFETLKHLEPGMPLTPWWADHYLMVFERR